MREKKIYSILVLLLILIFNYCTDKSPVEPVEEKPVFETQQISGAVNLPENVSIKNPDLKVYSPLKTENIKENGSFSVKSIINEKPQIILIANSSGDPLLLSPILPGQKSDIEISVRSTAKSLILMNPIFIFTSNEQRIKLLNSLDNNPKFEKLVTDLTTLLVEDTRNTLNYDQHPRIYEQVIDISFEILKNSNFNYNESESGGKSPLAENPYIKDAPGDKVLFYNPNTVYFAAEIYPSGVDEPKDVILLDAKNSLVSFKFGWPPIYYTDPTETEYELGNGTFKIQMTKGFDINVRSVSEFFDWNHGHGKATLANFGKFVVLTADLIIGYAPTTPITELRLDLTQSVYVLNKIKRDIADGDPLALMGDFAQLILETFEKMFVLTN